MSKPARRGLRFSSVDEMIADTERLRAGPYDRAGQWDLAMILDHLAKSMGAPFNAGTKNLPWPTAPVARFVMHWFARREVYPEIKFPAPNSIQPVPGMALEPVYAEFLRTARQVQNASGEMINWPPIGAVPLEDFRKIQLLHGAHHLSFLKLRE